MAIKTINKHGDIARRDERGHFLTGETGNKKGAMGSPRGQNKLSRLARSKLQEDMEEFLERMKAIARGKPYEDDIEAACPEKQFEALKWICDRLCPQLKQITVEELGEDGDDEKPTDVVTLRRNETGAFVVSGDALKGVFGEPPWKKQ